MTQSSGLRPAGLVGLAPPGPLPEGPTPGWCRDTPCELLKHTNTIQKEILSFMGSNTNGQNSISEMPWYPQLLRWTIQPGPIQSLSRIRRIRRPRWRNGIFPFLQAMDGWSIRIYSHGQIQKKTTHQIW